MAQLPPVDPDRIAILDDYGHRKTVIPAGVRGKYRDRRTKMHAVLILFFLALPWLRVGGHQAVLLDIPNRDFAFFGLRLYAHDAPFIFFVLAILVLGLALVTAVWGRVWCGWACPQTVFIDFLFRRIEEWTEGSYVERRRRERDGLKPRDVARRALKWFCFFIVSSLIAHSFVAYFVGARPLLQMMGGSPAENWTYFLWVSTFTGLILFDFGWFREQFCMIMCPYGRFQGLLMDSRSMAVLYDEKRGEPRRGSIAAASVADAKKAAGDCVSCRRCVEVCPTGIDIRKGLQMECIACTACMDACDEIMVKVKKPTGLIRYANLRGGTWDFKRLRVWMYAVLLVVCVGGLTWGLAGRGGIDATLLRGSDALFTEVGDGTLVNHRKLHVRNQSGRELRLELRATSGERPLEIATAENPFVLKAGEDRTLQLFVKFPAELTRGTGEAPATLEIREPPSSEAATGGLSVLRAFKLLGPATTAPTTAPAPTGGTR